ncbi:MAG TPA: hypothetical protein VLI05_05755 [Candidatus Saccharimonadia bacterium]|nr:hypothetical protein [Candidatus Saccharimonadia bacterium]
MNDLPPQHDRINFYVVNKLLGHATKKLRDRGLLPYWTDKNGTTVYSRAYAQGLSLYLGPSVSSLVAAQYLLKAAAETKAGSTLRQLARAFWRALREQNPDYSTTALYRQLMARAWAGSAEVTELARRKDIVWVTLRQAGIIEWLHFGKYYYYDRVFLEGLAALKEPLELAHIHLYYCRYLLETGQKAAYHKHLASLKRDGLVLRAGEAAARLNASHTALYRWRSQGSLTGYRLERGDYWYTASDIEALNQSRQDGLLDSEAADLLGVARGSFSAMAKKAQISRSSPGLGAVRHDELGVLELKRQREEGQSQAKKWFSSPQAAEALATSTKTLTALARHGELDRSLLSIGFCAYYYDPKAIERLRQARWCDPLGYEIVQRLRQERGLAGRVRYLEGWEVIRMLATPRRTMQGWKNLNLLPHYDIRAPGAQAAALRYPDLYLKELLFFAKGQRLCPSILREFRQGCEDLLTKDPNLPDLLVTEVSRAWYAANFQHKTPRLNSRVVAERLGVSVENVQRIIEVGRPSAAGELNRFTYDPAEINEFLRQHWVGSESDHDQYMRWLAQQEHMSPPELLDIKQVAKLLQVDDITILRWATNGYLPCYDLPLKKGAHSYRYIKPQMEELAAFCQGQKCTVKQVRAFPAHYQTERLSDTAQSEAARAR